ncbi:MAG: pentapeptide repeat-containing protein [Candidatus Phlomobacter fragariae]
MERADLTAANMLNAEMSSIDLTDANLEHTRRGVSLILTNAKLIGANLT